MECKPLKTKLDHYAKQYLRNERKDWNKAQLIGNRIGDNNRVLLNKVKEVIQCQKQN